MSHQAAPQVVLLGGNANALSIARNLGRNGIHVTVSVTDGYAALRSKFCRRPLPIPAGQPAGEYWAQLLLERPHDPDLRGSMLFALEDEAVEFLANNKTRLGCDYSMDDFVPAIHLSMLDKLKTLELATQAGVPTPGYCQVDNLDDLDRVRMDLEFPVVIKPVHAHLFRRHYPSIKVLIVERWEDLYGHVAEFLEKGLEIVVCELIPGPDSLLSSYYTYHDANGNPLFHYTKRVLRRHRLNCGKASYHISDWLPETAEAGKQFFSGIDYRGLGNVEFKRDPRDNVLKIIECNPRFTDAHELLVRCGVDTSLMIYNHLTQRENVQVDAYRQPNRLLFPLFDVVAYRQLRRKKLLTTGDWIRSLAFPHAFPYFSLSDPIPFFAESVRTMKDHLWKRAES